MYFVDSTMSTTSLETALDPKSPLLEKQAETAEGGMVSKFTRSYKHLYATVINTALSLWYGKPPAGISIEEVHAVDIAYGNWIRKYNFYPSPQNTSGFETGIFQNFLSSKFPQYVNNKEILIYLSRVFTRCL